MSTKKRVSKSKRKYATVCRIRKSYSIVSLIDRFKIKEFIDYFEILAYGHRYNHFLGIKEWIVTFEERRCECGVKLLNINCRYVFWKVTSNVLENYKKLKIKLIFKINI